MNKDHERDEDVAFEGLITVREMTNILINSKHLILSRVQVSQPGSRQHRHTQHSASLEP